MPLCGMETFEPSEYPASAVIPKATSGPRDLLNCSAYSKINMLCFAEHF